MVLYSVYRKRPHHGRYPRCGSSSVENIDEFFFSTIANLTNSLLQKTETFLKLRRADRGELFTANG